MAREGNMNRWGRMGLAVMAVILVTALAVSAAVTRVKALHITPSLAKPGELLQGAIELSIPAPAGGVKVTLEYTLHHRGGGDLNNPAPLASLYMPKEIFIPMGKTTGLFNVDVLQVRAPANLIVTATLGDSKQLVTVHLMPE